MSSEPLQQWLDQGQHWLGRLQATGLTCASTQLLAEGQHWSRHADLLGWPELVKLTECITDPQRALDERARAVLDLAGWVATAGRVVG